MKTSKNQELINKIEIYILKSISNWKIWKITDFFPKNSLNN